MEHQKQKNNLAEKLIEKIKSGNIKMKPKIYFILRSIIFAVLSLVVFFFLIYLVSFIFFSLVISGGWFLPAFGPSGFGRILMALPWLLVATSIILIIILQIFAERISFVYRRPAFYSLIGIIAIVLFTGFLVSQTPFHEQLFQRARQGGLPLIGPFYRDNAFMPQIPNVYNGVVTSISDNGFSMKTPIGDTFKVLINPNNPRLSGIKFKEGDTLIVIGKKNGNTINAIDLRMTNEDPNLFMPLPPPPLDSQAPQDLPPGLPPPI